MACTAYLACPVCGGSLTGSEGSARCAEGHSFDYARSGYLNLARPPRGRGRVGDTAAMVRARDELLGTGHYERIARGVAAAAREAGAKATVVAEIGSGTGYYLDAVVSGLRESDPGPECAFGFDLAKPAVALASRRHPSLRFAVADAEVAIPLVDAAAGLVLSVFSPRPAAELGRVTRPGGELVVAFAGPRHLERLRERLNLMSVQEDKLERLSARLAPWFDPLAAVPIEYEAKFGEDDARRLVAMGPNAWHDVDSSAVVGPVPDLVSVVVARFRRRHD
jgi:23S rRNA (guanine745-N1)-methyltransferase